MALVALLHVKSQEAQLHTKPLSPNSTPDDMHLTFEVRRLSAQAPRI